VSQIGSGSSKRLLFPCQRYRRALAGTRLLRPTRTRCFTRWLDRAAPKSCACTPQARKRAGVGGTTMLTASWWPWYEFSLGKRVPAAAFTPVPTVDGGILVIRRRAVPLVPSEQRKDYQDLVRQVFTGPGRGIRAVLRRHLPDRVVHDWLSREHLDSRTLPRDLKSDAWASLFGLHRQFGLSRSKSARSTARTVGHSDQTESQPKRRRGNPS
jgi:hypothetical protein